MTRLIALLLFSFSNVALAAPQALPAAPQGTPVVHSRAELELQMASGKTPLDALTPYGKRTFLSALAWGEKGLGGLSTTALVRELSAQQIGDLLRFLDSAGYIDMLTRELHDSAPLRFPEPGADVDRRSQAFHQAYEADARRRQDSAGPGTELGAAALVARYLAEFQTRMQPDALAASGLGDLPLLFDAASLANFAGTDPVTLHDMQAVYRELSRRHVDTRRTFDRTMLNALLAGRRFDEARAFAAAHPGALQGAIPQVADRLGAGFRGRSVYDFDIGSNTLTRTAAPPPAGIQVVMVVDAGCHFSANALQVIASDPGLLERLRGANLLLVTPPRQAIQFAFIANWNATHPQLPMRVPFSAEEWSDIDVAGVPVFFILENGRVREKITGWPESGQKEELLRALGTPAR